ncbi:MAG: galactose ABC transporter substrate-binding protein [Cellulosilyticaceae bacterium]
MKKKLLSVLLGSMILAATLTGCTSGSESAATDNNVATEQKQEQEEITVGVLVYKYDDTYISTVRAGIDKYAKEANVKIKLEMQDGQGDQAKQNDQLDVLIEKNVDVLAINTVDTGSAQGLANKAKAAGIPTIFFNREPSADVIESCEGIFIGTTAAEAGIMQGDILAELWKENPAYDLNNDGKVQYLVFKGEPGNPEAEARTSYSVSQAEANGLVMENVYGDAIVANWATDQAQASMEAVLAANEGGIEAVFCNNDDMALGVIAALNGSGYNLEKDSEKWIPVIGVDATDAGVEAIKNGKMAATVKQDGDAMGKAIVAIATNAALDKPFLEETEYQLAEDKISVRIPYSTVK